MYTVQITQGPPLRQTTLFHSTEAPLDLYSSRDFPPIYILIQILLIFKRQMLYRLFCILLLSPNVSWRLCHGVCTSTGTLTVFLGQKE